MKRKANGRKVAADRDTMRPEYDFSRGIRGGAALFARGGTAMLIDADVLDVFPDGSSVNEVLRALAPVVRRRRRAAKRRRSA